MKVIDVPYLIVGTTALLLTAISLTAGGKAPGQKEEDYIAQVPGPDRTPSKGAGEGVRPRGTGLSPGGMPRRRRRQVLGEGAGLSAQIKLDILDLHNQLRAASGAANMVKMHWDAALEQELELLMADCPSTLSGVPDGGTVFKLIPFSSTGDLKIRVSDNVTHYITEWFTLGESYSIDSDTCDEQHRCGLYKQLVWSATDRVGCAAQVCGPDTRFYETQRSAGFTLTDGAFLLLACGYRPGSTVLGQPYIGGEPCADCPQDKPLCQDSLCTAVDVPPPCECRNGGVVDSSSEESCTPGDATCIPSCTCHCPSILHTGNLCQIVIDREVATLSLHIGGSPPGYIYLVLPHLRRLVADVVNLYCPIHRELCCADTTTVGMEGPPGGAFTTQDDVYTTQDDVYTELFRQTGSIYHIYVYVQIGTRACSTSTSRGREDGDSPPLLANTIRAALQWSRVGLKEQLRTCCQVELTSLSTILPYQLTMSQDDDVRGDVSMGAHVREWLIWGSTLVVLMLLALLVVLTNGIMFRRHRRQKKAGKWKAPATVSNVTVRAHPLLPVMMVERSEAHRQPNLWESGLYGLRAVDRRVGYVRTDISTTEGHCVLPARRPVQNRGKRVHFTLQ